MTINRFKGTGVAVITPFQNDESIDFKAFENVVEFLISGKVEYIVAIGTTGESPSISDEERQSIIDFLSEKINKRIPLVVGIGGNNTKGTVKKIKSTNLKNVDALLSVCPYYNKPTQAGIYEHYKAVAADSPIPVMMYNVPGRTGANMTAETTLKLAHDCKNIFAMKESSGNLAQITDIIRNRPKDFLVISGDDALTVPIISIGGDGVISVAANACPHAFTDMVRLALANNMKEAQALHYKLSDLMTQLFADGSPGGAKAALHKRGLISNILRLPLVSVNDKVYQAIAKEIDKL